MSEDQDRFLKLLSIPSREAALETIEKLASELTGDQHRIRSIIIELHFAVEVDLRRYLFHLLKQTILFEDDAELKEKEDLLYKNVGRVPFGTMFSLLEATLHRAPWPDLASAKAINETRNKLAHSPDLSKVTYKGRSPFDDEDCLAQMYFEVWAFEQEYGKLFWRTIEEPLWHRQYFKEAFDEYKKRFGDIDFRIDGKRPIWS